MQLQETLQDLITYLRGMWRFRWYAMIIAWSIAIFGWVYVSKLPNIYDASAKVLLDTDSMLRPLLRGLAVQSDISQRVKLMTKKLLSRQNLEKVARMSDLDINAQSEQEMDALVGLLHKGIKLNSTRTQDMYTISATYKDPVVAKNIVQSILTIFIEDTLGNTRQNSSVAQKFLNDQIKEYERRLVEAEDRIKRFKQENIGNMPSASGDYFVQLQNAQTELTQTNLLLKELQNRRDEFKRQLEGEEPVFGFGTPIETSAPHPLNDRIEKLQIEIDELLLVYTERHPNVIARQETLNDLIQEREKDLESNPLPMPKRPQTLETNPIYQQLKISLGQTEAEISALKVRVKEYEIRLSKYKKLVNTGPEIEAKLQSLNRDYELNKSSYDTLVARLESAKLAEEAEQTGDDIRFEVIEPPRVPTAPSGPNRVLLSSGALIGALAFGLGIAFLLSQIKPVIYDRKTLKKISGYPVFGVVSRFWTPELLVKKRIEFGVFMSVGVLLVLVYSAVLVLQQSNIRIFEQLGLGVGL